MTNKRENDTIIPINGFQSEINMSALSLNSEKTKEINSTNDAFGISADAKK